MKSRTLAACLAGTSMLAMCTPIAFAATNQPSSKVNAATHTTTVNLSGHKLMTVQYTVATDPNSGHLTSWIPAMSVQSILSQLGMQAHWISGANQLVLNMPLGYTVPTNAQIANHSPKSGHFVMLANSKSIAAPPTLGKATNPSLPVFYVMKALQGLGVDSHWTGSTWNIEGKVHVQPQSSMPGDTSQTFSLTLSNKQTAVSTASLPNPPVPADPPVTVELPMNTLLKATNQPLAEADETLPMQGYVQTGRATYTVDQPIAAVESWFKTAYTAQGFSASGSGSSGNLKTGTYVESQTFTPNNQQQGQEEHVAMSYDAISATQTKVEYWVYDTVIPARPSSSQIPSNPTDIKVNISTTSQSSNSSTGTTVQTITNAQAINQVVAAINALKTIDAPGINPGGPLYRNISKATLTFDFADGHTVSVTATKHDSSYGDVVVGNIPLQDTSGSVWKAIQQAIGN